MLFKDLLLQCNVEKITREIMKLSEASESDYNQILKRYKILIDELIAQEEYTVMADKNFCFVAVPIENCSEKIKKTHNTDVYVSLYSMDNITDPYNTQIEEMRNNNDFSWFWGQFLGLCVYEKSVARYGVDIIVAGVLYYLTYYDYIEKDIKEIRDKLEKETDFSKTSQSQFYRELLHSLRLAKKTTLN